MSSKCMFACLAYDCQIAVGAHWNSKQDERIGFLKHRMVMYEQQSERIGTKRRMDM